MDIPKKISNFAAACKCCEPTNTLLIIMDQNNIPRYITSTRNTFHMVLWTTLYAELFITVYQPFNSRQWIQSVSELTYFLYATLAVVIAMLVITLSRTAMHYYGKNHRISYFDYSIWVAAEILGMSLVYALVPVITLHASERFLYLWGTAVLYTTFVLLIPYAIVMLALILRANRQRVAELENMLAGGEIHQEQPEMYNFHDEKGDLKMSIRPETLYYMESADNYVKIHYQNAGRVKQFMLRNSLRNLEETFADKDLIRCHRSYIVNFSKVKLLKRSEEGLMIDFDAAGVPNLPVSKTYAAKVMERFTADMAASATE